MERLLRHEVHLTPDLRGGPHGIDMITTSGGNTALEFHVVEVKTTSTRSGERPSFSPRSGQMTDRWVQWMEQSGVTGVEPTDLRSAVSKVGIHVNLKTNKVSVWNVTEDGKADELVYEIALDDLARYADSLRPNA